MKTLQCTLLTCAAITLVTSALAWNHITVNKDTMVQLILNRDLSTKNNEEGDKVTASCAGEDCGGFPRKTTFVGKITELSAAKGSTPGYMKVKFTQAVLPDNTKVTIDAIPMAKGEGTTKTQKKGQGAAAGIGALSGALIFGSKGLGAVVGGAAGAALGGKKEKVGTDVSAKKGAKFYIKFNKTVTFTTKSDDEHSEE